MTCTIRIFLCTALLSSGIGMLSTASAAPAAAQVCASCHGQQGQGGGIYPRIAGQPQEFLQNELRFFRSGARPNPMMRPVAKDLTDADITALAGYFSALHPPFTVAHLDLSSAQRQRGQELVTMGDWPHGVPACIRCHGPDLGGVAPLIPALAGQSRQYMLSGLRLMQSLHGQARYYPLQIMSHVSLGLSDTDISAVTGYIAALKQNDRPPIVRPAHDAAYRFTAQSPDNFTPPPESAIPAGPDGDEIWRGRMIFENTRKYAHQYVGDKLNCSGCHLDAGRRADAAPMWAAYVVYPKYRSKNRRVNTLEERIQDCFRFSMNGKPPPADSPEMVALVDYFHWLAIGLPVGIRPKGAGYPKLPAPHESPSIERGAVVYAANCALCHGDNGLGRVARGQQVFPPLWGPESFNHGAGMQRLSTAAAFIKANMPYGAAGLLSDQQAWDVAAFVVSHPRPQDPRLRSSGEETPEHKLWRVSPHR